MDALERLDIRSDPAVLDAMKNIGMNYNDFELLRHFAVLRPNMGMQPF